MDDWIPCEGQGKLTFVTSHKGNELWVSILEKAHAKLHGSYEALEGGVVHDALVDLIGGAKKEIDMFHESSQLDFVNGHLWFQLQIFKQEGFLLKVDSVSSSDVPISLNAIMQRHGYFLLQVTMVCLYLFLPLQTLWCTTRFVFFFIMFMLPLNYIFYRCVCL